MDINVAIQVITALNVSITVSNDINVAVEIPQSVSASFTDAEVFESDGLTSVAVLGSGDTFNIPKHDIILPDGVVEQSDEFNVDFNLAIVYDFPHHSGIDISYRTGDEQDIWDTIFSSGLLPAVGERALLDVDDFTKLLTKNSFGTLERFTNDLGLLTYDGSGGETIDYVVDNLTGLAFLRLLQTVISGGNGNASWNDQIDGALAWTQGVYSDFFLPSNNQIFSIQRNEPGTKVYNYTPFSSNTSTTPWTSTTSNASTGRAFRCNRDGEVQDSPKGDSRNAYYCRKHF